MFTSRDEATPGTWGTFTAQQQQQQQQQQTRPRKLRYQGKNYMRYQSCLAVLSINKSHVLTFPHTESTETMLNELVCANPNFYSYKKTHLRFPKLFNVIKNPTRCNSMQIFIYCKVILHVSAVTAPIIRSTKNCNRSLRYRSYGTATSL